MDLGRRITELRKRKGYTRDVLGNMTGTSGAVIGRYERSEITPSVETAKKIADALDVSLDYLAGSTDRELDKAMLRRIREVDNLSPREKELVYEFLDAFIAKSKIKKAVR